MNWLNFCAWVGAIMLYFVAIGAIGIAQLLGWLPL